MVYFKDCCEGVADALPTQKQRATLTTAPILLSTDKTNTFFCYGNFPRLDGAKLRKPPQCKQTPELVEPMIHVDIKKETLPLSPANASPSSQPSQTQSQHTRVATSRRNSQEWNQTTDAKQLFDMSSSHHTLSESEGSDDDEGSVEEEKDADFYEHDFKVVPTVAVLPVSGNEEKDAKSEEALTSFPTVAPPVVPPVASRWGRVPNFNFSIKQASQAAAAAASASVSAVASSARASTVKTTRPTTSTVPITPVTADTTPIKVEGEAVDSEPEITEVKEESPPVKVRPFLTKWDPSSPRTTSGDKSNGSLWDKSALAFDSDSRNRFSQTQASRRRSEASIMSSPPISRRGSLRLSDTARTGQ